MFIYSHFRRTGPGHQQIKLLSVQPWLQMLKPLQLCCLFACAKALRSKHCFRHQQGGLSMYVQPPPQGQRKGSCSEAAFTSPMVQFCLMLLTSLWASFGFQSSFASIQRLSVRRCLRLPNWSSPSHYFPNQLYGSEFVPVLNLVQWEPEHFVTKCPYRDHQILQLERHNVLK